MAACPPFSLSNNTTSSAPIALSSTSFMSLGRRVITIPGSTAKWGKIDKNNGRLLGSVKRNAAFRLDASRESMKLSQELEINNVESLTETGFETDLFDEMKHRFLSFKRLRYLQNLDHFQKLANDQAPKFMVIACADSRVCPSNILGFQPGEAFVVRNVANLVPPFEKGPSETNAALEFAVNSLEVQNILVSGHSRCGGIRALMSMQDDEDPGSFIKNWVIVGKNARSSTRTTATHFSFDQQCRHCEKESVNHSLENLLTYPWIKERVSKGLLFIHGGYYDFVNCTYEKWTLDFMGSGMEERGQYTIKDKAFWS